MSGLTDLIGKMRSADVAGTQKLLNLRAGALGIAPLRTDGVFDAATQRALANYANRLLGTAPGGKPRGFDAVAAALADTSPSALMREGARGRDARGRMSGAHWAERAAAFADSRELADLTPLFAARVFRFLDSLSRAGALVRISATKRDPVRAWLHRNASAVARGLVAPGDVLPEPRAPVIWDHGDLDRSRTAAAEMARALGPDQPPPEGAPHFDGHVISMTIRWSGAIEVVDGHGAAHSLDQPYDGVPGPDLQAIGRSYNVGKIVEPLDWSFDG